MIYGRYSSRFNFDIACNMDFHRFKGSHLIENRQLPETDRFPVDEQYCQVKFESFGFTNKQVINWAGFCRNYYQQIISHIFVLQIQLAWMEESQNNVNQNISLAQFGFK